MPIATDACGLDLTTSAPEAIGAWNRAVENLLAHARALPAALDEVFAADPDIVAGWCLKGFCAFTLARSELRPVVDDALARASRSAGRRGTTGREGAMVEALSLLAPGRSGAAADRLDAWLAIAPRDALVAKLVQSLRFMRGEAALMRASAGRVVAALPAAHPHGGFMRGCLAFALEETGDYARAESIGREAVELCPRDAWGLHAVAHVHEMTGRPDAGAAWIETRQDSAAHCNNFAGHVFWHLALFKLEAGDTGAALLLYDTRIRAERTDDFRDIANAASLLTRLTLAGARVGPRWEELADLAAGRIGDGSLAFADLHYALALIGAGRADGARQLADAVAACARGDQREVAGVVGAPLLEALMARADGRHADAATRLIALRPRLAALGGSHAQRDVIEQIALDSAVRGGLVEEARRLLIARLAARPGNRFAADRLAALGPGSRRGGRAVRDAIAATPVR